MGQHLQLYASRSVTIEDAQTWCHLRAHDIDRVPTSDQKIVRRRVDTAMQDSNVCHGSKRAVHVLDFLVWETHRITEELIQRVISASENGDLNSEHVVDWMRERIGWVLWGDNDGI